jgi:hypothetical protein
MGRSGGSGWGGKSADIVRLGESWLGNASGTRMGRGVMGMGEQGRRSLGKAVSLVSESVDHSSEASESRVSSSESAPPRLVVAPVPVVSWMWSRVLSG